jgi:hypothetical protein
MDRHGPAELISFLHPARQEISIDERKSISRDNAKKTLAAGSQYVETAAKFDEERRGNPAFRILEEQKST